MELSPEHKVAWLYLVDNCDCAGILDANLKLIYFMIGATLDADELLKAMGGRVVEVRPGKWFIPSFIKFQYGTELNPNNSAHLGVLKRLQQYGLQSPVPVISEGNIANIPNTPLKGLPRGYQAPQDKDKDKDKKGECEGETPEVPSEKQAIAATSCAGIPEDFIRYVYSMWSQRSGKDAQGVCVKWLPYVTRRWSREQNEWLNGTHKGKPKPNKTNGQPPSRNDGTFNKATGKYARLAR